MSEPRKWPWLYYATMFVSGINIGDAVVLRHKDPWLAIACAFMGGLLAEQTATIRRERR